VEGFLKDFIVSFWGTISDMAPFLLFGFLVAGLLAVFFRSEFVEKHLGGSGFLQVVKASVFGVPLPLCSCGVIPVAASLRKHGAGPGATASFLISTPQTGVDSIMVTLSLLGPVFAVFRPLVAFVTGIVGGMLVNLFGEKESAVKKEDVDLCDTGCMDDLEHEMGSLDSHDHEYEDSKGAARSRTLNKIRFALRYGFVTIPADINKTLVVGLLVAAAISALVPDDYFAGVLGSGFLSMLIMMAVGIPIYVCATASVPIAAVLIMKGISPGAALVFLMTGPATNAATISTIWKIMGRRSAVIYLLTVAVSALAAGMLLNALFGGSPVRGLSSEMWMVPGIVRTLSAVALIAILLWTFFRPRRVGEVILSDELKKLKIMIEGMTCEHCAMSVRRALLESKGVASAEVDLRGAYALVTGGELDTEEMRDSVEKLGYRVTGFETVD